MFPERKGGVTCGLQEERLAGSVVFVLPNPSGRNANYSYTEMLAAFRALERHLRGAGSAACRSEAAKGAGGKRTRLNASSRRAAR
jgi:hypothetical protein